MQLINRLYNFSIDFPYGLAREHWKKAHEGECLHGMIHGVLAVLEFIPIVGLIPALAEYSLRGRVSPTPPPLARRVKPAAQQILPFYIGNLKHIPNYVDPNIPIRPAPPQRREEIQPLPPPPVVASPPPEPAAPKKVLHPMVARLEADSKPHPLDSEQAHIDQLKPGEFFIRRSMTWTESKPVYAVVIKIASDNIIRDRVYVDEAKNQFVFGVPVNTIEEHVEARKREFFKPPEEEEPFRFVVEPQMPPDDYVEERYGTSSPGERSTASNGFMSRLDCRMGAGIQIGKETYIPVTGNIHSFSNPKKKVVSVGSSIDREIIVLDQDPTKCPLLATHFMTLKGELLAAKAKNGDKPLSTEQVLQHVKTYVRGKIFPSCRDRKLMAKFEAFLNKARQTKGRPTTNHRDHPGRPIPFIWVDEVIKEDAGVCRHHALVTCYLLDRLTKGKNPILSGTVTHLRENVPGGAHIWTVFIPKGSKTEKWHLDTMWGVLENFVNPDAVSRLKKSYGDAAIDSQIYRTQHL